MAEKIVKDSQSLVKDLVNDTISRRAAIDIVRFECGEWEGLAKTIIKRFKQLPSAQPERKKGKWIFKEDFRIVDGYDWKCDQCGSRQRYASNYCPKCGARMEGRDN